MFEILIKLFWIAFEMGLIVAEFYFCIQLREVLKLHKKFKKEYSLATNNGYNGHSGRLMKEIEKDLINMRIEVISWASIVIACAYAVVDCLTTHIM